MAYPKPATKETYDTGTLELKWLQVKNDAANNLSGIQTRKGNHLQT